MAAGEVGMIAFTSSPQIERLVEVARQQKLESELVQGLARARVAVLPCCHDVSVSDAGALSGWMDDALAIDVVRARRLAGQGYHIWTQRIPRDITPMNRLLIGVPPDVPASP